MDIDDAAGRTGAASARRTLPSFEWPSDLTAGDGLGGRAISMTLAATDLASCSAGSLGLEMRAHWTETGDDTGTTAERVVNRGDSAAVGWTLDGREPEPASAIAAEGGLRAMGAVDLAGRVRPGEA
jgi:hypothetical protein